MKDGLDIIKNGLANDSDGNFLILVIFIIFSCIWGSHYLNATRIASNEDLLDEHDDEIHEINEELAERKPYIFKNVTEK